MTDSERGRQDCLAYRLPPYEGVSLEYREAYRAAIAQRDAIIEINDWEKKMKMIAGTNNYHEAVKRLQEIAGRQFNREELDAVRKSCKNERPKGADSRTLTSAPRNVRDI